MVVEVNEEDAEEGCGSGAGGRRQREEGREKEREKREKEKKEEDGPSFEPPTKNKILFPIRASSFPLFLWLCRLSLHR